jgi:hypothetical protein
MAFLGQTYVKWESMIKKLLEVGMLIALIMMTGSCKKELMPAPQINWANYTGNWENVNAFGDKLNRITISRRAKGQLSVQLWGSCGMEECERGLFTYDGSDLNQASLPMRVFWNRQDVAINLTTTASGKLELKAMDNNTGSFEAQYFSWMQTASFYQQVTQTDAGSLLLTSKPINGSPRDPDNQLTSGSILVFQTSEGRLGKMQVHGNDFFLSVRWVTWSPDGAIHHFIDYYPVYRSGYYDLDDGKWDDSADHRYSEFYWSLEDQTIRWLEPLNGAAFALYHLK